MNNSYELEDKWDKMTEKEKLLAYSTALLNDAVRRDSFKKFKNEQNVANFWYEARVTYAYGQGKR